MREGASLRFDRRWLAAALVGVVAIAAVAVWWTVRDRPDFDQELWCERAVAMVQANEDLLLAGLEGGYEAELPRLIDVFESKRDAVLEVEQPEPVDGLIPYGVDAQKSDTVFDYVAAECGYRFNVNNGRLPEPG